MSWLRERTGELAQAEQRFLRRRRTVRWRRWLRGLVAVAVVAFVGGLGYLVFFSSVLVVRITDVRGASLTLPKATVVTAIGPIRGVQLARLDVADLRSRVAAIPAVAYVSVSRSWPDRVIVTVTERIPTVAISEPDRTDVGLADASGVVFRRQAERPPGVPVAYVSGDRREQSVPAAVAVTTGLPSWLRPRVLSISATSPDSVALNLDRDVKVVLGSAENLPQKFAVLQPLMKQRAARYDVSAPELPVTRGR